MAQRKDNLAKKARENAIHIALFGILLLYAVFLISLIAWGFSTALKSDLDFRYNKIGLPSGWPWDWSWANFAGVFSEFKVPAVVDGQQVTRNLWQMLLYTLLYTFGGAFVSTFVPCAVAYAAAKFKYKFSKLLYTIVIVAMVLPIVGSAPAERYILETLHIYNTIWGNWIQKAHFLGIYFLIFHAAFSNISAEFSEAAYIDGAGEFKVFFRIMLPLVATVFSTVFLIKIVDLWNDYQTPLLYLPSYPTLAYGVYSLSVTSNNAISTVPMRMAACMLLLTPITALFVVARKKLMGNITMGGVKE